MLVYELSKQDKIGLAAVEILGKEYALPAFMMARNINTSNEKSVKVLLSRWLSSPKAKEFRAEVRAKITKVATVEGNDLTTRDGLINELVTSVRETQGKDAVSGLQTLAKLQGFDKMADPRPEADRVMYVVPSIPRCRDCQLRKILNEIVTEQERKR